MRKGLWRGVLLAVMFATLAGCDSNTPPTETEVPPDSVTTPTDSIVAPTYSPAQAVVKFGRYRVDSTPEVVRPTTTPDGDFVAVSTSPSGHRVGKVAARLAVWPADASTPTYMFRADTVEPKPVLSALISDREEVLLVIGTYASDSVYVWRANQLKLAQGRNCKAVTALSARGMIGLNSTCVFYNYGGTLWSPLDPDSTRSGRFGLGASCQFGGRTSSIIAIDDENDVLKWGEIAIALSTGYKVDGGAGTCATLPALPREEGGYGDYWTSLRSGLVGGAHGTSSGPNNGLLSDGARIAFVNDLLTQAAAQEWKILSVDRIEAGKTLVCLAVSLKDGHKATIRLVPAG
jgi:hypothetical protein